MPAFPISRYLVPSPPMSEPPGYTVVDEPLTGGLPVTLALTQELTLVVGMATGLAQTWRDTDPGTVVSSSADQWQAFTPPEPEAGAPGPMRATLRLVLIRAGTIVAAVPAVAGRPVLLVAGGDPTLGTVVELTVTAWIIYAGTVVGAGDYGSRLRFGWRLADIATDPFMPPPISPNIVSRLRDKRQTQSVLGTGVKRSPAGYGLPWSYVIIDELPLELIAELQDEFLPNLRVLSGTPSSWEVGW